jgi:hypothetical protein
MLFIFGSFTLNLGFGIEKGITPSSELLLNSKSFDGQN